MKRRDPITHRIRLSRSLFLFAVTVAAVLGASFSAIGGQEDDQSALAKYEQYLRALDKTDPRSVSAARSQYLVSIVKEDQNTRDRAFVTFLSFYGDVAKSVCGAILYADFETVWARAAKTPEPKREVCGTETMDVYPGGKIHSNHIDAAIRRIVDDPHLASLLKRNGLVWGGGEEEGYFLRHDQNFVADVFLPHISRSLKEYTLLRGRELPEVFVGDGSLGVQAPELARRVAGWEKYLKDFPNSLLKEDAVYLSKLYLASFIKLETYNHPSKETGASGEYVREWRHYVGEHPGTRSAAFVGEYLKLAESNGYTVGAWAHSFYEKFDIYLNSLGRGPTDTCILSSVFRPSLDDES